MAYHSSFEGIVRGLPQGIEPTVTVVADAGSISYTESIDLSYSQPDITETGIWTVEVEISGSGSSGEQWGPFTLIITAPGCVSETISTHSFDILLKKQTLASMMSDGTNTYWLKDIDVREKLDIQLDTRANTSLSNLSVAGQAVIDNSITAVLNTLYPVGAIFIGTMATCPLATLGIGTWTLVSSGKVLQGADSSNVAGTSIAAGLPDITGSLISRSYTSQYSGAITSASGALKFTAHSGSGQSSVSVASTSVNSDKTEFKASNSNSIYGNSTTVQPPAYAVNIWERTA